MCPSRVLVASTPCVNLRRRADVDYVDPLLLYCFVFWFSWMAADRAGHSGPQRCGAHGCNFALDDCDEFWIRLTIEMVKMSCHLANAIVIDVCLVSGMNWWSSVGSWNPAIVRRSMNAVNISTTSSLTTPHSARSAVSFLLCSFGSICINLTQISALGLNF